MNITTLPQLKSRNQELDLSPECFGALRSSMVLLDDEEALRERIVEDGYLFLPGYLDHDLALETRGVITDRLAEEGFLDPSFPAYEAIAKPGLELIMKADLAENNESLTELLYSGRMMKFYETFLGGAVLHYDHTWMRAVAPGSEGTFPHCDIVYMGRGTRDLYTSWTPLGDIPLEVGGLLILENSHRKQAQLKNYLSRDVDTYCTNYKDAPLIESGDKMFQWAGELSKNPKTLREKLGGRWLTAHFHPGDLLLFTMATVHASLDNASNQIRLSSDSRYQLASEPVDERWIGKTQIRHGVAAKRGRIC